MTQDIGGDVEIRNAIISLSIAMGKSHAKLRTFAKKGYSSPITARLRGGSLLSSGDRGMLADLLDGLLDRNAKSFDLNEVKAALIRRVRELKATARGKKPRVIMETIYETAVRDWNDSPMSPRRITVAELRLWYEKQKSPKK